MTSLWLVLTLLCTPAWGAVKIPPPDDVELPQWEINEAGTRLTHGNQVRTFREFLGGQCYSPREDDEWRSDRALAIACCDGTDRPLYFVEEMPYALNSWTIELDGLHHDGYPVRDFKLAKHWKCYTDADDGARRRMQGIEDDCCHGHGAW